MKSIAEQLLRRLISVKSLVTLILTLVFSALALRGEIGKDFMTVYAIVIAFYFSAQATGRGEE